MDLDRIFYDVTLLDDGTGWKFNSLVPEPAIEVDWNLFEKANPKPKKRINVSELYENISDDKRLIHGPIMIPDIEILRKFRDGSGYYNCMFTEESIENTLKKAAKEERFNNVSLNHWKPMKNYMTQESVEGVYLMEVFLEGKRAKSLVYDNLNVGTIMGTYWVEDEKFWNEVVKSGDFNGFSIEINVNMVAEEEIKKDLYNRTKFILESKMSEDEKKYKITKLLNLDRY